VATAEAALRQSWREQARLLLERYATWQRERAAARVAGEQVAVAAEQAQAVGRRQRLGDAARMEALQADAALSQSQALQATAQARADAAQAALQAQFQGAWQPGEKAPHLPPPQPPPATPADALRVWLDASAELAVARLEARSAAAQRDVESLDRRPDPTLGVRVGRALGGAEQVLMFTASLPFGGAYRQAGVDATAERAAQMEALALDLERRLAIEAQARLRELQTTYTGWQRSAMAARQFEQSAAGLARSYQLGEGSLGEVLAARRLANEQRQAEALAAVDAWLAVWRTALESGQLWPAPNEPGAAATVAPGG
jgi:outer membrane protein TolC